jgi:hypothetical protein
MESIFSKNGRHLFCFKMLLLISLCQVSLAKIRLEAEDAESTGPVVMSEWAGYSNTGYMFFNAAGGTGITFAVDAPAAGDYLITIRYYIPLDWSDKVNDFYVNGEFAFDHNFLMTGQWQEVELGPVTLNMGENTIEIRHNWGWIGVDYIELPFESEPTVVASNPNPADEEDDVLRDVVLSWTSGEFAPATNGHKVFFSENFVDVNDGVGGIIQDANSFTPPAILEFSKTYYWRVDEVDGPPGYNVHEGDVWQFTTEPFAYAIENITATASSEAENQGAENTMNGSGLDVNDLHSKATEAMWLSSSDGPELAWIEYEFDKVYKLYEMWVWNYNGESILSGFGLKNVTIKYSTDGTDYTTLGDTHEFDKATGTNDYAYNTTVNFDGIAAKYVRITANSNWGGAMYNQYGLSEVKFFYIPVHARKPIPSLDATDVPLDVVLRWRAGREAAEHKVYLDTDQQAVIDGTTAVMTLADAGYGPLSLDLGQTYYWKVDEVNTAEMPTTWKGDVWNFTTHEYFVVDDFESYEGGNAPLEENIWFFWHDGVGYGTPGVPPYSPGNGTGSEVGDLTTASYTEETIVHGGGQSMPFKYNNIGGASYSEAEADISDLGIDSDWTKAGIKVLTLYFYGDPNNTAGAPGQMYVKLNGVEVPYDDDAADIQEASWHEWNIELSSLDGVDLQNVTKIIIGIGNVGASGIVYFDDIRLYPSRCILSHRSGDFAKVDYVEDCVVDYRELEVMANEWLGSGYEITPVNPGTTNLAAHYTFDDNTNDSAGGHHGTANGLPGYTSGKFGQAILLDGVDDIVTVGPVGISGAAPRTIAGWVKPNATSTIPDWTGIFGFVGPDSGTRENMSFNMQRRGGEDYLCIDVYGWIQNIVELDLEWHHLAATYDGTTIRWYGDGRLVGNEDRTLDTRDEFQMGKRADNDNYFPGCIDEVHIYGRALSDVEIAWLAGYTSPFSEPFDMSQDGTVDFKDFAKLADVWLDEQFWP